MFDPKYDGLIEQWKVDLIIERARFMRMRRHEYPDVLQTLVPELMKFRYDPAHSNGAQERTVLITVIDNHLRWMRRTIKRYRGHVERFGWTRTKFSSEEVKPVKIDVADAIAKLTPDEQAVCHGLAESRSIHDIAKQLGCGWHTVERLIRGIRQQFAALGLDEWVCP